MRLPGCIAAIWIGFHLGAGAGVVDAHAGNYREYADYLLREGDTYRAISVYKELLFFSEDPDSTRALLIQLGHAYRVSGRPAAAVFYYDAVLREDPSGARDPERARLGLAMAYVQMRSLPLAEQVMSASSRRDHPDLCVPHTLTSALIRAESGAYGEASSILRGVSEHPCPGNPPWPEQLDSWIDRFDAGPPGPKSPFLAGLLSGILPGAGQIYSGHVFDAVQSFGFVTTFALATWAAFLHERDHDGSYLLTGALGTSTAVFHAANIAGAARTAGYANMKAREDLIGGFRAAVLKMNF